ncbi:TetR/AcrR family transcriptional regulator, partial [Ancrocorticia populi]
ARPTKTGKQGRLTAPATPMSTPTRAVRTRAKTVEKRAEILQAAVEVFGEKGYSKATLQEIADRVGITHAGVLHHFGSKQQLLLEAVKYRDNADLAGYEEKVIPDGMEQFAHLIRTAKMNEARPGIVQTFVVLSTEAISDRGSAREYYEERYRTLREEISENFRNLCQQRGASDATARSGAIAILAAMDGIQYQWLMNPDEVDLTAETEFAINAIVRAVLDPA